MGSPLDLDYAIKVAADAYDAFNPGAEAEHIQTKLEEVVSRRGLHGDAERPFREKMRKLLKKELRKPTAKGDERREEKAEWMFAYWYWQERFIQCTDEGRFADIYLWPLPSRHWYSVSPERSAYGAAVFADQFRIASPSMTASGDFQRVIPMPPQSGPMPPFADTIQHGAAWPASSLRLEGGHAAPSIPPALGQPRVVRES